MLMRDMGAAAHAVLLGRDGRVLSRVSCLYWPPVCGVDSMSHDGRDREREQSEGQSESAIL